MTTTDDVPPTLRVRGLAGLLAAVPALLGFHPRESLVLVCMHGPRHRIGPVIRVDLVPLDLTLPMQLANQAARHADCVAVLAYSDAVSDAATDRWATRWHRPDRSGPSYDCRGQPALLAATLQALRGRKIPLVGVFEVRGGSARSLDADDRHPSVPAPGPDREDEAEMATMRSAMAIAGHRILADREELAASIAPPTGANAAAAGVAFDMATRRVLHLLETESMSDSDPVVGRTLVVAEAGLATTRQRGCVDIDVAAELAILLTLIPARDALIARVVVETMSDWLPMLVSAASQVSDPDAVALCAVLAVAAYRQGSGALAQIALDRVLQVDPEMSLAHLLSAMLAAGAPPGDLEVMAVGRSA